MPNGVSERSARYIHAEQIAEHGGLHGPSREGALEAALARPQNLRAYAQKESSLGRLAAAYGFLIALAFSLWPIGKARRVAAAALFRDLVAPV